MHAREKTIEEYIINALQRGSLRTTDLKEKISLSRPNTTKQGVYRALRKLKREEKIVIYHKNVSLSLNWIRDMSEFFSLAQFYNTQGVIGADNFLNIRPRDKVVYYFKNLNLLGAFGDHVFHLLSEVTDPKDPVFAYNPHEWFAYARERAEETLIEVLAVKNRQVLITVTHNDYLDRLLKNRFNTDLLQYHISAKQLSPKENYYVNIFGDYLMEIFIDPTIASLINRFYAETSSFDAEAQNRLLQIIALRGKNKLIISKNAVKAKKIRKVLEKNFYIKQ